MDKLREIWSETDSNWNLIGIGSFQLQNYRKKAAGTTQQTKLFLVVMNNPLDDDARRGRKLSAQFP